MARWATAFSGTVRTPLFFDEPTNACWFVAADGQIWSLRVLGQRLQAVGSGWTSAVAVLPSTDGLHLFVVLSTGDVAVVTRARANKDDASVLVSIGAPAVVAYRLVDNTIIVLDDAGHLGAIAPFDRTINTLIRLEGATLLTVDEAAGEVLLAVPGATTTVHRFKIDGTAVGTPVKISARAVAIAPPPPAESGVVVCDDSGRVFRHDWLGVIDPFTFDIQDVAAICRWQSLFIAAEPTSFALVEWGEDITVLPTTASPNPLVRSGWTSLHVDYAAAGLTQADVEWTVDEGPMAARISVARPTDRAFEHRVIAGYDAPEFHIRGCVVATGKVVATRRFRLVRIWPDTEVGPPLAVTGPQRVYPRGGKWGGGPAGPQNIATHAAPEELKIAVAVFRLRDSKSSVNGAQRVVDLTADVDGSGASVRRYYEEVSYRSTPASPNPAHPKGTTVTLLGGSVFGPIDIDYAWGDLFEHSNPKALWDAWNPKGDTWDILGGEFSSFLLRQSLSDLITKKADSFVLTVLPATDDPYDVKDDEKWPAQWTWAFAGDCQIYWKDALSSTFKRIAAVVMPAALPKNHPSPWAPHEFMTTICHELGHNLGCPDLYKGASVAEIDDRYMTGWDLMDADSPLPHFSLPHRMQLGWIHPDWIEVCDFGQNPASRTVRLHAIEGLTRSGPPAGSKAGVEVRIRDGWNYYYEYRRKQAGAVGDQKIKPANVVVGTDIYTAPKDKQLEEIEGVPGSRPLILLLPKDVDNDGPLLAKANQDYKESDVTNPDRMNDFTLTRQSSVLVPITDHSVDVQITYQGAHRAELQLRPAPGGGNFKSPDIDLDGPAGPNIAVKGKINTIKVRVHNRGTKAADAVQIRVQWLPFTTAPGPWNALPNPPTQMIPAHATREFIVSWNLSGSVKVGTDEAEHFCVRADVDRYIDPTDPSGSEIVVYNNWAQSNFSTDAVGHASPSDRKSTILTATNVLRRRAMHRTLVEQTSPYFRTYVDHAWRRLTPRQSDVTQLSYESLAGDPLQDNVFRIAFREAQDHGLVNDLSARTFVMPERIFDGPQERWGVQLLIRAGLRTRIESLFTSGELVSGAVAAGDDSERMTVTAGTVRLVAWPVRRLDEQVLRDGQVDGDGTFRLLVPSEVLWLATHEPVMVAVFYLGTTRFAPCHSGDVTLRTG